MSLREQFLDLCCCHYISCCSEASYGSSSGCLMGSKIQTKKILVRLSLHNMSLNWTIQKHFYTLNSPAIYKAEWLTMPLLGLIIVKYSQKCLQVVQNSCCVAELLSRRRLRWCHFTPTVESLHSIQLESGSYFKSLSLLLEWWMVEHLLVSAVNWQQDPEVLRSVAADCLLASNPKERRLLCEHFRHTVEYPSFLELPLYTL